MKKILKRLLSLAMCLILLISMLPVSALAADGDADTNARPGRPGGPGDDSNDYYDHIDVRQEGASITLTYITRNMVTGEIISKQDVTIACSVSAIKSVSYTQLAGTDNAQTWTWTSGFTNDGTGYEFRQMGLQLSKDLSGSYATIIVDLTDTAGNVYEDVTFTFGPAGCQQALEDCDGYSSSGGRGSVGLDFILGQNDGALVEYTNWVIPVKKLWDDAANQDGIRPASVQVQLYANGVAVEGMVATLNEENNWYYEFKDLEGVDAEGNTITYTIQEVSVPEGYTATVDNQKFTVTNSHTPAVTSVSGSKTWEDANNQDGVRPESITVNLLANGEVVATKVVTANDGWAWTFVDLPKFENGTEIIYSITEDAVDGYSATYNGHNVTNTHTPAETSVTVTKAWNDAGNQDGIRPLSVTVNLLANGEPTGDTLILSAGNNWTGSFTGLPKFEAGQEIVYTVEEVAVSGYTSTVSGDAANGFTVTNSHTPAVTSVSGSKTWNDRDNQDGARPESITVNLLANGQIVDSKVVTEADGWAWTFEGLPKYENGTEIVYSITENAVDGYSTTYNGYNVTNTHTPAEVSVTVTKSWVDGNNQDGFRPNDITVVLLANGDPAGQSLVLNEGNKWTGSFTGLPKFEGGVEIVYTIEEIAVPNYEVSVSGDASTGFTVTNTHIPETVSVSGAKTWDDADNQDGARPESITVNLLANGKVVQTLTVTEADGWAWTFENLPKYENGTLITYSVSEEAVEGYSTTYNGYDITNSYTPAEISVTVAKAWNDANNQDGYRPNDITVVLLANGDPAGQTLVLNEGNKWTGSFTGLPKFEDGVEIVYTIEEVQVPHYEVTVTGDAAKGFTLTNTHNPETVSISGAKTWVDSENQDGARPESITVNLLANGKVVQTLTVTEADSWAWTFENLPKFENGTQITYSVTEEAVDGYTTTYNGYDITNTHTPAEVSVTVTKAWSDSNNQDGIRPNDVTVVLLANGEKTGDTLTLNAGNNWTGSFTGLDKFKSGKEIVYSVEELTVSGYASVITGTPSEGFVITNSHTPAVVSVSGAKTWNDADNQDGARPESITVNLLANGKVVESLTVTEADGWAWTFENLPKYENGTEIVYSITEDALDGYTTIYNGYNVTNSYTPAETSVTVTKSWADSNNQDGIRPNDVTVVLLANGEKTGDTLTLNAGNNWTGSFTGLDKFASGKEIVYTVEELSVPGYSTVITGKQATGFTITNSHTPAVVSVSGAKTWNDESNQDGKRPESITVNLLANGKVVQTMVVTEADGWAWTFENLPKYENGTEIVYSITEDAVDGYTTIYNGYNVTNSYTPAEISITVTKAWSDSNNQDGIRPNDVTVVLLANGEKTGKTLVLSSGNNWTDSFVGLDKFAGGKEIVYTVEELAVEGYNVTVTGDAAKGFTITNTHNPETVVISGEKTWQDKRNQDGKRPDSITVNLLANGKVVETLVVTEADGWAWTFEDMPKFENGTEIVYTIAEEAVEGYTTTYDGYNVINKYDPELISVNVTKSWEDSNNQDGIRPEEITVVLLANGEETGKTLTLTAEDNWTGTFKDLDKFAEGEEIVYTIEELEVTGYSTVISGSAKDGFVITNSHTPETVSVAGGKTWDDNNNQDGIRPESITVNLLANGQVTATKVVTEADGWAWTFENLPKYENGTEIVYTITEEAVEGYVTSYEGYNVINKYDPAKININVTKAWVDSNNGEGIRPDSVTIHLFANGTDTGLSLVLTAETEWRGAFENLPKFAGGELIEYTITEDEVSGYNAVIKGTAEDGFLVTNSHNYIPQTGDDRNPMIWVSMMSVSLLVMVLASASLFGKKRKTAK